MADIKRAGNGLLEILEGSSQEKNNVIAMMTLLNSVKPWGLNFSPATETPSIHIHNTIGAIIPEELTKEQLLEAINNFPGVGKADFLKELFTLKDLTTWAFDLEEISVPLMLAGWKLGIWNVVFPSELGTEEFVGALITLDEYNKKILDLTGLASGHVLMGRYATTQEMATHFKGQRKILRFFADWFAGLLDKLNRQIRGEDIPARAEEIANRILGHEGKTTKRYSIVFMYKGRAHLGGKPDTRKVLLAEGKLLEKLQAGTFCTGCEYNESTSLEQKKLMNIDFPKAYLVDVSKYAGPYELLEGSKDTPELRDVVDTFAGRLAMVPVKMELEEELMKTAKQLDVNKCCINQITFH